MKEKKLFIYSLMFVVGVSLTACDLDFNSKKTSNRKLGVRTPTVETSPVKEIPSPVPLVFRDSFVEPRIAFEMSSSSDLEVKSSSSVARKPREVVAQSSEAEVASSEEKDLCGPTPKGMLCDSRDGQIYRLVKIDRQIWMAQNLNYASGGSWCYEDRPENCATYGRLYRWTAAMDLPPSYLSLSAKSLLQAPYRGVCPKGFHIPSNREMVRLLNHVLSKIGNEENSENVGSALKKRFDWRNNEMGTVNSDLVGFGAMPAGYRAPDGFYGLLHEDASFWVAEESANCSHAPYWNLYYNNQDFLGDYNKLKSFALSVRCVQD